MANFIARMFGSSTGLFANNRRERALRKHAIDDTLWHATLAALPFFGHLDQDEHARLREMTSLFISEKSFSTAHELPLTDAMIVAIAVQACLPVLNLGLELYRGWVGVIVYPGEFVIRKTVEDEDGVVHEIEQEASGEAWEGGPVVLSWEDAQIDGGADAYNVVIHEFAHKIDMLNGEADGPSTPVSPMACSTRRHRVERRPSTPAYDHFCAQVDGVSSRRWNRFERESLIDPYAAEHPSEFFAVCSEALFVKPVVFERAYPDLYQLLARYYRQDPASTGTQQTV